MRISRFRVLTPLLAAVAVVLAIVGVVFTLHSRISGVEGVTAATPPDAVHVVVTKFGSEYGWGQGSPPLTTVYDKTLTDAAVVRRLQADLNGPTATGPGSEPPTCAMPGVPGRDQQYELTYDFLFTAGGQAIEHAVVSWRCGAIGVRAGFAPTLALGPERGYPALWRDAEGSTYITSGPQGPSWMQPAGPDPDHQP